METVAEMKAETTTESREQIASNFLSVAATTTAAMLYTAAYKLIESNFF